MQVKSTLAKSIRAVCVGAAAALAASAAQAGPGAFPSFALAPLDQAVKATPVGLSGFESAETDTRFALPVDFSAPAVLDAAPTRAARPEWRDLPSNPSLAARRMVFDIPAEPQISFERTYSRELRRDDAAPRDEE